MRGVAAPGRKQLVLPRLGAAGPVYLEVPDRPRGSEHGLWNQAASAVVAAPPLPWQVA